MHTRLSVCLVLLCTPGLAQQAADLTQLSVDDLAKIQVTSASKKAESLSQAPAAIYVLTGEAIREGGFATLPEALRTVPGLYVVQTNSHSWQLSTRGFSGIDNRKMLVLVDGRSVYCPIFGGVFWDLEDIPLENIDWSARAQQTAGEYQVEAAYLYNFAKTARWASRDPARSCRFDHRGPRGRRRLRKGAARRFSGQRYQRPRHRDPLSSIPGRGEILPRGIFPGRGTDQSGDNYPARQIKCLAGGAKQRFSK